MQEFVVDGLVLTKEPLGELDIRVSLFTKQFGKLTARARSARKILSKLSPHLEPGQFVVARFVEKKGLQIVDALSAPHASLSPDNLHFLGELTAEYEPDEDLWSALTESPFHWHTVLARLGWDARHARCESCGKAEPVSFHVRTQHFFCMPCALSLPANALLYLSTLTIPLPPAI